MKDFSVPMAIVDFVPVVLFTIAAIMLQRDLYNKMSKGAFALFAAGTIDIIFASFLKALYKLLYAVGICDFDVLNTLFFPINSIGFLLAGLGVVAMLLHKQTENAALAVAPPLPFKGTPIFISFMVIGLAMMYIVLSIVAIKLKKPLIIAILVLSFCCSLCMGYLSSKNFDAAIWNWIAQGVNVLGQGTFLISVVMLRKAGLGQLLLE